MPAPSRPPVKSRQPAKRPAARRPAPKGRPPKAKGGLDIYHMLAVASGAFAGLALYALLTPGQIPTDKAEVRPDPRADLVLTQLKGKRSDDGLMVVRGQLVNDRDAPCRLASVSVRFFDAGGKQVANTFTTAENIPGRGKEPFEARAHAPEAVRFEVAVDMAQFEVTHDKP